MSRIVLLGTDGFPFGMAAVQKQFLIAKALKDINNDVTVISKKSFNKNCTLPFKGSFDGIDYIYTNLSASEHKNKIFKHISWIFGSIFEKILILFSDFNYAIVSSRSFIDILAYSIICKIKSIKIFLTYVEDNDSMPSAKSNFGRINNIFFNKYAWKMIDGAFPISHFLSDKIREKNPLLPQMFLPVSVDLDYFNNLKQEDINHQTYSYYLFCGAAGYLQTIKFIVYGYLFSNSDKKLILVLNGNLSELEIVSKFLSGKNQKNNIIVISNLSYSTLVSFYKFAFCLLIPLNFDTRDKARYPHKLGEYCASKRPIISSNWGEIPYYFTNLENIILLDSDEYEKLADKMKLLENDNVLCDRLGNNAYEVAKEYFDYKKQGQRIVSFFQSN